MLSACTRSPIIRRRKLTFLSKLLIGYGVSVATLGCTAAPAGTKPVIVPDDVRALVAQTDTLLAYKAADLYGDGSWAAVMVVRHQASESSDFDFDHNPCELLVLRRVSGKLVQADHSRKAVDCTYNDVERHAPAMSLNVYLQVSPGNIAFTNQKARGNSSFHFSWSKKKGTWYLRRATATNVENGRGINDVKVIDVSASYPKNFGWTPMSSVDPDALAEVLIKQTK